MGIEKQFIVIVMKNCPWCNPTKGCKDKYRQYGIRTPGLVEEYCTNENGNWTISRITNNNNNRKNTQKN